MVHDQHYDESLEVSDGEEVASANPTPREQGEHTGTLENQLNAPLMLYPLRDGLYAGVKL